MATDLTSRRSFLAICAGMASVAGARGLHACAAASPARFLAARRFGGRYEAALIDQRGHDLAVAALPDRGHSFAIDAAGSRAVAFGRQPGFFAQAFSLTDGAPQGLLPLPEGRHYFGHGVFSLDATRLYATENDYEAGRGVLGVYDARSGAGWQRLTEFDTAGIGPHEVVLMPDGRTLCVANGGLLTHPDFGKTSLNLTTMRPSLVYLDAADGRLLEKVELPPALFQLSIRHLVVDAAGAVWFACQHEGPATQQPPLVGRHRRGAAPELFSGPPQVLRSLRNYLGSIAIDTERGIVATSSPVGGHIAYWSTADGRCLGATARADGCGIASLGTARFLISDGYGAMLEAGPGSDEHLLVAGSRELSWDNHLRHL